MFTTLFFNVFTVFLLMLPGFMLIRSRIIRTETLKDLSHIVVKVFYPCLVFGSITSNFTIEKVLQSWQLPLSIFMILVVGYLVGLAFTAFFKTKDKKLKKSILFQLTVNNYSFLPLAIIAKLFDGEYVAALIFSTLGAELTVWTLGMFILAPSKGLSIGQLKPLLAPPLIGIYFSLIVLALLSAFSLTIDDINEKFTVLSYFYNTVKQIGAATIPLAMVMAGGRMAKIQWKDLKTPEIWYVTVLRLLLIPLTAIAMLKLLFASHPWLDVMLIVAIMPTSIISVILGELHEADHRLISGTVLVTHLVALVSIPLWLMFLLN